MSPAPSSEVRANESRRVAICFGSVLSISNTLVKRKRECSELGALLQWLKIFTIPESVADHSTIKSDLVNFNRYFGSNINTYLHKTKHMLKAQLTFSHHIES